VSDVIVPKEPSFAFIAVGACEAIKVLMDARSSIISFPIEWVKFYRPKVVQHRIYNNIFFSAEARILFPLLVLAYMLANRAIRISQGQIVCKCNQIKLQIKSNLSKFDHPYHIKAIKK